VAALRVKKEQILIKLKQSEDFIDQIDLFSMTGTRKAKENLAFCKEILYLVKDAAMSPIIITEDNKSDMLIQPSASLTSLTQDTSRSNQDALANGFSASSDSVKLADELEHLLPVIVKCLQLGAYERQ
jgi:hypothetical protein